jgi:4-amino-4-deoxy-L-arabinose transferase-like glycosyltransferase
VGQALQVFIICCGAGGFVLALKPDTVIAEHWLGKTVAAINQTQPFHLRRAFLGLVSTMSGIFLLFLLAETNGGLLDSSLLKHVDSVFQFAFLVFGVILLTVGMGGRIRLPIMSRREIAVLSGLIVLTLVLRFVALDTNVHRFIDEVNFMEAVPRLWARPDTPILVPFSGTTSFTWLYTLFQSGISNIVGSGLIGLRLISTIFGTLGVVALYFLVRTLFHNKWLAIVAAILLSTFPAHLHFSRLGLNNIADPFWGTLALAFLMRGLQSHQRSDYVIAGAALGLTQYFYEGGRLLYPPLLAAVFIVAWLLTGHRKTDFIHACCALLVALLIAAPVYYTLLATRQFLTPRLDTQLLAGNFLTSLFGNSTSISEWLGNHLLYPFLMYISIPDQGWFYGGQQPLIILPLIPFFLLGMVYGLWKYRSPAFIVLLMWIMATALGNSLLRDNLWSPRYVVAFPALAVFVALGLYAILVLVWPRTKSEQWFYRVLVGAGILLGAVQTVFYFRDQVPFFLQQFQGQNVGQEDWNDAFFRMVDLPSGTEVHIIMEKPMWDMNTDAFLSYNRLNLKVDTLRPVQVTKAYITKITVSSADQQIFFINPGQKEVLTQLRQYFILDTPQFGYENVPMQYQLGLYKARLIQNDLR